MIIVSRTMFIVSSIHCLISGIGIVHVVSSFRYSYQGSVFIVTRLGSLVSEISVSQNGRSNDGPEVESPAQPRRNDLDPDGGRVRRERVDVGVRAESKKKNVRRVWNLGN